MKFIPGVDLRAGLLLDKLTDIVEVAQVRHAGALKDFANILVDTGIMQFNSIMSHRYHIFFLIVI